MATAMEASLINKRLFAYLYKNTIYLFLENVISADLK